MHLHIIQFDNAIAVVDLHCFLLFDLQDQIRALILGTCSQTQQYASSEVSHLFLSI